MSNFSGDGDRIVWYRSSHSTTDGGVMVGLGPNQTVLVRDGKDLSQSPMVVTYQAWEAFLEGVRNLEFAHLSDPKASEPEETIALNLALKLAAASSRIAVEDGRADEWRGELIELACEGTRRQVILFALGLVVASVRSQMEAALLLVREQGVKTLRWILKSNIRTWAPLSLLLVLAGRETIKDTGAFAALLLVLTSVCALHGAIEWLRKRLNVNDKSEASTYP
ncbi:DUF397 domain-containing protein [Streptosporangium sandarakinum]|uniref:DUF397 domain-containing protein n=1 Tax=Streptosporangium sandarakinum TaxID=1260955 RepID=UPI0037126FDF